jgi:phage baseplate assembly protein W
MPDANLLWGTDLDISATGDIATTTASALGMQRVLRRLLTNPGDYIWQPDYGGGLAQYVGVPADISAIKARIRSQIFMEAAVARLPEPAIDVQGTTDGSVYVSIRYVDSTSGQTQILSFSVST